MPPTLLHPRHRASNAGRGGWLILGLWMLSGASVRAGGAPPASPPTPSPRDALRRLIEPVVDAFSRRPDGPDRALTLHWRIAEATAQRPEFRGTRLTFLCQAPDRVYFQFVALDTLVTLCRNGQSVWMSPADRLAPLLAQVEQKPPTSEDREPLAPVRLTIPTKLFWALFYLVSVQDAGRAPLGAQTCRRLDLHPPEAKKGEYLRLWIDPADPAKLARVEFAGPDSRASLDVEDERLSASIPAADFEPDDAQRANLLNVPVERFRPLMTLLGKEEDKRRKQFVRDHPPAADKSRADGQ